MIDTNSVLAFSNGAALGPKERSAIRLEIASSHDSLLEQAGFEPSVPLKRGRVLPPR